METGLRSSIVVGLCWLLAVFLVGCINPSQSKWVYSFDGHTKNLLGLGSEGRRLGVVEEEDAFLGTLVTVEYRGSSTLAIACNGKAAGTLLLAFNAAKEGSQHLYGDTEDGTLRAWLVRPSSVLFRKRATGEIGAWMQDEDVFHRLVDDRTAGGSVANAIPLSGKADVRLSAQGFRDLYVKLQTLKPMPPHLDYIRDYLEVVGDKDGRVKSLLDQPATAPFSIHGTFHGGYNAHAIPI
jgi:hypothetical protein